MTEFLEDELPPVPGGWGLRRIPLGPESISLYVPARMEALLAGGSKSGETVPYWARLWPAAEEAARAVFLQAPWPVGSEVLELGSGVGLVGLAALRRGDAVRFTDCFPEALQTCRVNGRLQGISEPRVALLDWRIPTELRAAAVLACDVLYEPALHEPLLRTIAAVLEPRGVCWIADPGREASLLFASLASEWFFLRVLTSSGREALYPSRTEFQILELRHRCGANGGTCA